VVVEPGNTTTIQSYNTTGPVNTLSSGGFFGTSVPGAHVYTSVTATNQTACLLTPASFSQNHAVTVNAFTCEPDFFDDAGPMAHLTVPSGGAKIKIALPSSMSSAAADLDAAIASWNSQIATTSIEFERASCSSGDACIVVSSANLGGFCGESTWFQTGKDGGMIGPLTLEVSTNWASFSAAERKRTFMHELGHFLGLKNFAPTGCEPDDAVMQADFGCNIGSTPLTTVTPNDYIPVTSTVYGGKSNKTCGW
jgi:hypothetical protein